MFRRRRVYGGDFFGYDVNGNFYGLMKDFEVMMAPVYDNFQLCTTVVKNCVSKD